MSNIVPKQLDTKLLNYAGVIWQVTPASAARAETDWLPLTALGCIAMRHQRVNRFNSKYGGPFQQDSTPAWVLGGRLDGYTVRFERHLRTYDLSNGPWPSADREVQQMRLLAKGLQQATRQKFYAVMPEFPEFYFAATDGRMPPQLHSDALREDAAAAFQVPDAEVTEDQLLETWYAAKRQVQLDWVWPQRYFLGAEATVPVRAWCNISKLLGFSMVNHAWQVLRDEGFISGRFQAGKDVTSVLIETWQRGAQMVLTEHKLLPVADPTATELSTPRPQDIVQLRINLMRSPQTAALAWADYLDMLGDLLPSQRSKHNWERQIASCRAGEVPTEFRELRTMPAYFSDPRLPDNRLCHVIARMRARYERRAASLLDADIIQALRNPGEPLVASRVAKPFVYRHLGTPTLEAMCFQLPGLYCDLFTAPAGAEEWYAPAVCNESYGGGGHDSTRNATTTGYRATQLDASVGDV